MSYNVISVRGELVRHVGGEISYNVISGRGGIVQHGHGRGLQIINDVERHRRTSLTTCKGEQPGAIHIVMTWNDIVTCRQ